MSKLEPGYLAISKATRQIVRVTSLSSCGKWFGGVANPDMPPNFQYSWHEWRVESFTVKQ